MFQKSAFKVLRIQTGASWPEKTLLLKASGYAGHLAKFLNYEAMMGSLSHPSLELLSLNNPEKKTEK